MFCLPRYELQFRKADNNKGVSPARILHMKYFSIYGALLCLAFYGCNEDTARGFLPTDQAVSSSLTEIGIADADSVIRIKLPEKLDESSAFFVSDVVESVRYVPLETTKESLISYIEKVVPYKDYILVLDVFGKGFLAFDSKGRFRHRIGSEGKGPGEFLNPIAFTVDAQNEEVLLFDDKSHKIIHYSLEGKFIREQRVGFRFNDFEVFEDGTYAINTDTRTNSHLNSIESSRLVYADTSWKVTANDFPYDISTESGLNYSRRAVSKFGNRMLYSPTFSYNIYALTKSGAKEKYYLDAGKLKLPEGFNKNLSNDEFLKKYDSRNSKHIYMGYEVLETNDHLVNTLYYQGRQVFLYYSKNTGKLFCSPFIKNDRWQSYFDLYPAIGVTDDAEFISTINALDIYNSNKKEVGVRETITKEVLALADSIKEGDNPVLVFYQLKKF